METLGTLADGTRVINRTVSTLRPDILPFIAELLGKIEPKGRSFFIQSVDLGRQIGYGQCVKTDSTDLVFYAIRENHAGHTRFTQRRDPVPTSKAVLILKHDDVNDYYVLISAYFGDKRPHEPWDKHAKPDSDHYWKNHAIVWDKTIKIVSDSRTKECPWKKKRG